MNNLYTKLAKKICNISPYKIFEQIILFITLIGVVIVYIIFLYDGILQELYNSILLGIFVSWIFYILVVYLPAKRKRRIIKRTFQNHYKSFKKNLIETFLQQINKSGVNGSELLNLKEFKKFFKEKDNEEDNWDKVLNNLEEDKYFREGVLIEMNILRQEILFILNNIEINDTKAYEFLKKLSFNLYRNQNINPNTDDIKKLSHFLWEVFTGWNPIKGYSEKDIFEKIFKQI